MSSVVSVLILWAICTAGPTAPRGNCTTPLAIPGTSGARSTPQAPASFEIPCACCREDAFEDILEDDDEDSENHVLIAILAPTDSEIDPLALSGPAKLCRAFSPFSIRSPLLRC